MTPTTFDAVIVGAGPAGLSAALVLGRSRRHVLVLYSGQPRDAPSHAVHSFFSRDGAPPHDLLAAGRAQLAPYDTVHLLDTPALDAAPTPSGFRVTLASDRAVTARRLLLASGVVDDLPAIDGLPERWGRSVLNCAYCHAWELRDAPLAALGAPPEDYLLAFILTQWSPDIVLCTNGAGVLPTAERARLAHAGISLREEPIARLDGPGDTLATIFFAAGPPLPRRALFLRPTVHQHSHLPHRLGCTLTPTNLLQVDDACRTTVPGVYAAGDCANSVHQVSVAVAQGARAAVTLNNDLILAGVLAG